MSEPARLSYTQRTIWRSVDCCGKGSCNTMARPFEAFVGACVMNACTTQSQYVTFTFDNSANFDAYVPITIGVPATADISAGAEVTVYRSTDGGATWETEGNVQMAFSRPTVA